ncbi:protein Wnt-4 [Bactrocera dorsalis]|uniref:Protein Wnt n=2 Tax=Bactrocera dorsalis TaxID=27457 RepID=A0ABM3KAR9_BACDO|nr:protein Wnt-4 [Bactrocera dorsalis]
MNGKSCNILNDIYLTIDLKAMKMHLLWLISSMGLSLLRLQLTQCNDIEKLRIGIAGNQNENSVGNNGQLNTNSGINRNDLALINTNNSMLGTILSGGGTTNKDVNDDNSFGETNTGVSVNFETGLSDKGSIKGDSDFPLAAVPGLGHNTDFISTGQFRGHKQIKPYGQQYGHALAGLTNLGIIIPKSKGSNLEDFARNSGSRKMQTKVDSEINLMDSTNISGSNGGQNTYLERFISEHTIMAVFTSQGQVGGPCLYMPATRRQNHQCRKEFGLPNSIFEARRLATSHCESQFRYDRWNCSIETRGKRNIFKKLYKETAFVHALTAAALTHTIARSCAEGRMTKCICGPRKQNKIGQDFQWGGCNDNLKHGKRVTRSFLNLRDSDDDEVSEILRHDSEVGIEAVSTLMMDKCKCHGVSGSCSMKTCWKKLSEFNATATLLRQKYNEAIRKAPNLRTIRRNAPMHRLKRLKQKRRKQSQYTTLYYLETSPTYCSVTKDRQCLHPDNCANLCCGRGYTTHVFKQVEKCRCRFNNGRCCQLICDYCQRFEDKYFCK